ncbi:CaiB/BaiF CoA-transferase family protein [Variovorax sp. J22R115]|uniref:CaiB/BaiF CoA transferase family protein n=1 Tax=Variovorax sp. J22R115 TaxID=3053509 RepID=UPI0025752157|nr:CaiB/BaiF CoA-transferase family protein [Variovorax sp. J22R115]MDM0053571.1 CaiB/BaiF CoA-transferase family protein [Variovorax sp. J22R115]
MQPQLGPLAGIRVLDLSGGAEQYCGKLFAQLGADVLLVEPLAGSSQRREAPFIDGSAHPETSLSFAYFNQGKRGIALDLDSGAGQDVLLKLAGGADLVIESERPGLMTERGLDAKSLSQTNPSLVVTSITPFGQEGPYAQFEGGDLVTLAFGGLLSLGGYPEMAPTAPYGNQAILSAAQFAAVASMMALWEVEGQSEPRTGQHIDVSVQESVAMALENAVQFVELEGSIRKRNGGEQRQAGTGVFPCGDGMIYLMAGGVASNKFWKTTANWLVETGATGAEELLNDRWFDHAFLQTAEAKQLFAGIFLPYAATRTKAELYEEGQRRRIPICPVSTTADLLQNRQLTHRQFFEETVHPHSGRSFFVPGAPYRLSQSPWTLGRPAPQLGEHTHEVLAELGLSNEQQAVLLREGVIA